MTNKDILHATQDYKRGIAEINRLKLQQGLMIYGGSNLQPNHPYYKDCEWVSEQVAKYCKDNKIDIPFLSGGGAGAMLAWLEPAHKLGLRCYGIATPNVPEFEGSWRQHHPKLCLVLDSFTAREQTMYYASYLDIFFPGSLGTINEFCDLLVGRYCGHNRDNESLMLYPTKYWKPIVELLNNGRKEGIVKDKYIKMFKTFDTKEDLANHIIKTLSKQLEQGR